MSFNIIQSVFLLAVFASAPGALAAPCPSGIRSLIKKGSTDSMAPVNYKMVAHALNMRKSDFIARHELAFDGGPLMPCIQKRGFEECMTPGNPSSAKKINGTFLLTRDNPPDEIPMTWLKQIVTYECVAYDPSSKGLIRLTRKKISWKVQGASHNVITSANSYSGYRLFAVSDF